jgi:hypothetical protein
MLLAKKFVFVCLVITDFLLSAEYHYRATLLDITYLNVEFDTHM